MNLNPADGHMMEYTTGWADGLDIGSADRAFIADYINKEVWNMPVNRIAIVRHNMVWTQLFSLFFFIKELSIKYVRKSFQLTVLMYKEARNYILSKSFACPLNG